VSYGKRVISVCGELVADLIEQPDGMLRPVPGGSPANTALACAHLGLDVDFLGRFGHDVFGERAWDRLEAAGVRLAGSVRAAEPSTLAVATTDEDGHAHYSFWTTGTADWQWSASELAHAPVPGTRVVHTASVASWTPPGAHAVGEMLGRARASRTMLVSYDPNIRPALLSASSPDLVHRAIGYAHVVKVSDEDLLTLRPGADPVDTARSWLDLGPDLVVVTAGARGAVAVRAGRDPVQVAAPQVQVVDTIGAGDTFTAGMLHALTGLLAPDADPAGQLRDLDDEQVRQALRTAAAAAAITCTRAGCHPPDAAELAAALAE
jgi:fructokinase